MNRVHHHAVASRLCCCCRRCHTVCLVEQLLIVACIVLSMETSREAEIGELDVPCLVNQNVVGFDITEKMGLISTR